MRLHLPKGLLAALLAACFALPAGAAITTTELTSLVVDGVTLPTGTYKQVTTTNKDSITTLGKAAATFLKANGAGEDNQRFKVTSADTVSNAGTLVIAQASVDGSPASAGQLYLARWISSGYLSSALKITNNLIIGQSAMANVIRLSDSTADASKGGTITISGGITLAQNAQIGVDKTCGANSAFISGSIIGEGKTLSIVRSNGDAAGYLNLGTGSEGKTLKLGGLSVSGTNVTMNYASAEVGNLSVASGASFTNSGTLTISGVVSSGTTLANSGTLTISGVASSGTSITNSGTFEISGIFRGTIISQTGDSASLVLGKDSVINLDGLTVVQAAAWGDTLTASGWQIATAASQYRLSDGGSVSNSGAKFRVGGSEFTTATLSDGVVSLTESRYNIISGDSVAISAITEATNAPSAPSEYYIYVSQGGTLTGVSGVLGVGVSGSGTIQTSGELTFDDRLNSFTGSIELGSLGMTSSDVSFECRSGLVLTADSKITSKSGTVNTISGAISGAHGLTIAGGGVTILSGVNTFTGGITVQEGTLKLSGVSNREFCGTNGNSVTVERGATFDLNGTHSQGRLPAVILNGGILTNGSTTNVGTDRRQLDSITLTANSEIKATSRFGLVRDQYAAATISLGTYTLTKTGTGQFDASSTSVTGTGKIRIENGTFNFYRYDGTKQACSLEDGVGIELAGGELSGAFETKGKSDDSSTTVPVVTIHGEENGTVSAAITNNGTLKVTSEAGKVVTFTGAITNGATGAVLQIGDTSAEGTAIGGTAKLTAAINADTISQIKVLNGGSLILDGNNINGYYAGTITVDEGGKMLSTNNENYNIVNGGSGRLVLNGEFTIDTTNGTNNVNGISGSGVVKTAQNATLNMDSTSNFTGSVVSSGESDKAVTLAFAEGTTASLKKLSATNGSTLNAKGIADYSVTTDPDSGVVTTTGGLSVSELVIGTGSTVQAWTGTGDYSEDTEATVLMKGAEGAPVTLTVGTAGQAGTSTLNANLVLDGATLTLNNALTMGSTLTLNDVTLSGDLLAGWTDRTQSLTLFSGVDALALGTGIASGEAITEENGVDASTYFKNLGQGEFLLTYTGVAGGGEVSLVNVPEPTTATLSLLALMGLAARRRRRKA